MASPHSSAYSAASHHSNTASTPAPVAPQPTLPTLASYLTAYNPTTGTSQVVAAGLAPPPKIPSYANPPSIEQVIQMIADMQQSIATLMVTIAELVQRVNR
jgi:hypothetical protein